MTYPTHCGNEAARIPTHCGTYLETHPYTSPTEPTMPPLPDPAPEPPASFGGPLFDNLQLTHP